MGQLKNFLMEKEGRGYSEPPCKIVCFHHFDDNHIKQFIKRNASKGECEYCGRKGNVIELSTLVEFLFEKIFTYYGDIHEQVLPSFNSWFESEDEDDLTCPWYECYGYAMPRNREPYDRDELFVEVGLNIDNDVLYNDIKNCLDATEVYCLKNALYDTKEEELSYKWKQFCKIVTCERRYTFFEMFKSEEEQYSTNGLGDILSELWDAVIHVDLIQTLAPNESLYRCRPHEKDEVVDTLETLASPPSDKACRNRMSPTGISMFYGAFDSVTAFEEIKDKAMECVTTGVFKIIKPIKVANLRNLPSHFSIFGNHDYYVMKFLESFVKEISKQISDKDKDIDYVPTQILTEYFRHIFKTKDGENIYGLMYQSAVIRGGTCCVLFFDNETCAEYLTLQRFTLQSFT